MKPSAAPRGQRCDELYPGSFPYSFDFLYWEASCAFEGGFRVQGPGFRVFRVMRAAGLAPSSHPEASRSSIRHSLQEVGVIDVELVRNLLICGGVILVVPGCVFGA